MRKLILFLLIVSAGLLTAMTDAKITHVNSSSYQYTYHPDAIFDSIWVNHDQLREGNKGMLIHLKFTVYAMTDIDCNVAIYFNYGFENPIKDKNKKFYTQGGDVAVFSYLKPKYEETVYKDLQVFMPYDELEVGPGTHKLKMDVDFNYDDGTRIQHLRYYDFTFTKK